MATRDWRSEQLQEVSVDAAVFYLGGDFSRITQPELHKAASRVVIMHPTTHQA